jgi:hypothetical protein
MELKIFAMIFLLFILASCASLEQSSQCEENRSAYGDHGLDIDKFRIKSESREQLATEVVRENPGNGLVYMQWAQFLDDVTVLRGNAVKTCGTKDGSKDPGMEVVPPVLYQTLDRFSRANRSLKAANAFAKKISDKSLIEPLKLFTKRERYDISNTEDADNLLQKIHDAGLVDVSKPWHREDSFVFPRLNGQLKEDAESSRKRYIKQWVLQEYNDLLYLTFFNPQLQKLLQNKIPLRLPSQAAEEVCQKLADQLSTKFDIQQGPAGFPDTTYWQINLDGGGTIQEGCEGSVGMELDHDNDTNYLRDLLKDKFRRDKLLQHLIATALTIDAVRISDNEIKLNMSINWSEFFENVRVIGRI